MTTDPWAVNAPTLPDREAQFAALLSHYHALDDSARSHIMTAHQAAVTAAVTAVLDSLGAELDQAADRARGNSDPARQNAYYLAARLVRQRIPVPF